MNEKDVPSVVYLPSFDFGSPALLVSVDRNSLESLTSQFGRLSSARDGSISVSFSIEGGSPIQSDDRCLLIVELANDLKGSQLTRVSESTFHWNVSRFSANHYRELLSGLTYKAHQYLDPDNSPPAPVVIVSWGEYDAG